MPPVVNFLASFDTQPWLPGMYVWRGSVALEESDVLAQTCLRMGKEWSKMKAWSKNAYKYVVS